MKNKQTFFKRSLALFLSLLFVVGVFPAAVFAAPAPTLLYKIDNEVGFLANVFPSSGAALKKDILDETLDITSVKSTASTAVKNAALDGDDNIRYGNFEVSFDAKIVISDFPDAAGIIAALAKYLNSAAMTKINTDGYIPVTITIAKNGTTSWDLNLGLNALSNFGLKVALAVFGISSLSDITPIKEEDINLKVTVSTASDTAKFQFVDPRDPAEVHINPPSPYEEPKYSDWCVVRYSYKEYVNELQYALGQAIDQVNTPSDIISVIYNNGTFSNCKVFVTAATSGPADWDSATVTELTSATNLIPGTYYAHIVCDPEGTDIEDDYKVGTSYDFMIIVSKGDASIIVNDKIIKAEAAFPADLVIVNPLDISHIELYVGLEDDDISKIDPDLGVYLNISNVVIPTDALVGLIFDILDSDNLTSIIGTLDPSIASAVNTILGLMNSGFVPEEIIVIAVKALLTSLGIDTSTDTIPLTAILNAITNNDAFKAILGLKIDFTSSSITLGDIYNLASNDISGFITGLDRISTIPFFTSIVNMVNKANETISGLLGKVKLSFGRPSTDIVSSYIVFGAIFDIAGNYGEDFDIGSLTILPKIESKNIVYKNPVLPTSAPFDQLGGIIGSVEELNNVVGKVNDVLVKIDNVIDQLPKEVTAPLLKLVNDPIRNLSGIRDLLRTARFLTLPSTQLARDLDSMIVSLGSVIEILTSYQSDILNFEAILTGIAGKITLSKPTTEIIKLLDKVEAYLTAVNEKSVGAIEYNEDFDFLSTVYKDGGADASSASLFIGFKDSAPHKLYISKNVPSELGIYIQVTLAVDAKGNTISIDPLCRIFKVIPKNIDADNVDIEISCDHCGTNPCEYDLDDDGDQIAHNTTITVTHYGKTTYELKYGLGNDYTVEYVGDNVNVTDDGYTITVTGIGNYTNYVSDEFTIAPKSINDDGIVVVIECERCGNVDFDGCVYDGEIHTPKITITHNGTTLVEDTDYTVDYDPDDFDFKDAGEAEIIIEGINNYKDIWGEESTVIDIDKAEAVDGEIFLFQKYNASTLYGITLTDYEDVIPDGYEITRVTYMGTDAASDVITHNGNPVCGISDPYLGMVSFTSRAGNVGEKETITLKVDFKNHTTINVTITLELNGKDTLPAPTNLAFVDGVARWNAVANASGYEVVLYRGGIEVARKTTAGTSYDFTSIIANAYGDYTFAVRALGNVNWNDSVYSSISPVYSTGIDPMYWYMMASIVTGELTAKVDSAVYNGKAQTPDVVVKTSVTNILKEGTDYKLKYTNNINAGTGKVTITPLGKYVNHKQINLEFTIEKAVLTATTVETTFYLGEVGLPEIEVTGFVNGETEKTAAGYKAPSFGDVYVPERIAEFLITPVGGEADNYTFKYVTGSVFVVEDEHTTCYYKNYTDLGDAFEDSHKAIDFVVGNGFFKGTSATEFSPLAPMNRAMIPTVLSRISGIEEDADAECVFPDVDTSKFGYAIAAINWGFENGIIMGYDEETFGAGDDVTIEQAVTFIYRFVKFSGADVTVEGDYDLSEYEISEYAVDAMTWAFANNMITEAELATAGEPAARILFAEMLYAIADIIVE